MRRNEKVWRVAAVLRKPVIDAICRPTFLIANLTKDDHKRLRSIQGRMERLVNLLADDELQHIYDRFHPVEDATLNTAQTEEEELRADSSGSEVSSSQIAVDGRRG